jgi:hypothetical protein
MARVQILTKEEQKIFSTPPKFNFTQKEYYFKLPEELQKFSITLRDSKNKVYFSLLYGYYKASSIFYSIESSHYDDIKYVLEQLQIKDNFSNFKLPTSNISRYKQIIKQYFGVNNYTNTIKQFLLKEATTLASNFIHRKKIFYNLVEFSKKLKIEVPSYTELSKIISLAINSQKQDILDRLTPFIKDEKLNVLDEFLQKDTNTKNRWHLARYKKLEHGTNKKKMIASLIKFNTIKSKFKITQSIIEEIGLTPKIARYHARWIEKSQVFQVKRKKNIESNFLLLSFIYYQYLIRNDNLIDRFISTVQTARNSSLRTQKEYSFELEPQKNRVMQSLEDTNLSTLNDIESVIKGYKCIIGNFLPYKLKIS